MVTLEQINAVSPEASDWIATLRASVDSHDAQTREQKATSGMQGLFVGKLSKATGQADKEAQTADRHTFIEAVFGVEGGSSKTLSQAQCHATVTWLDDGGTALVPKIVEAARAATDVVVQEAVALGAQIKPESTEERKMHWSEQNGSERKFWEFVDKLGLSPADVYEKVGQDRLQDFPSKESVVELLKAAADGKRAEIKEGLKPQEAVHGEARTIAFLDVYAPDGTMVSLTARQGARPDDVVDTALALTDAWGTLKDLGFTQVPARPPRRAPGGNGGGSKPRPRQTTTSRPEPTAPPSPAPPTPSPAPVAPVLAPPTPAAVAAPAASNGNYIDCDEIRIGLSRTQNPCIQL